eukprot:jgi/Bigna1/72117/fgenesh1_pg.18_\
MARVLVAIVLVQMKGGLQTSIFGELAVPGARKDKWYRKLAEDRGLELQRWKEKTLDASGEVEGLQIELESLKSKLASVRMEAREKEGHCSDLQNKIKQMQRDGRTEEAGLISKLKESEEEIRNLKFSMAAQEQKYTTEIEKIKDTAAQKSAKEITSLHEMVKKTVGKKDNVISKLTAKLQSLEERNQQITDRIKTKGYMNNDDSDHSVATNMRMMPFGMLLDSRSNECNVRLYTVHRHVYGTARAVYDMIIMAP